MSIQEPVLNQHEINHRVENQVRKGRIPVLAGPPDSKLPRRFKMAPRQNCTKKQNI